MDDTSPRVRPMVPSTTWTTPRWAAPELVAQASTEPGFWVGLALLQTLFVLEHNAICDLLRAEYPSYGDLVGPVRVLHTPGHTPGHLAFWWPERRILFAGDAIATYPVFEAGWPAFNLNPTQQRTSIRRMAHVEAEVVAVGHGDSITGGAAERLRSLV
jgi:glyoxylase-like metal-dependent hydrolase (beta-lactamase superfamily II)